MAKDIILGIESSCDDTSASVIADGVMLSNVIASQKVHADYGGVVPELASREHQKNILPVVSEAIKQAGINKNDISAIAFTRGPGLMGSLHVGVSFAKALAIALRVRTIDVNHLHGHILSHFIKTEKDTPVPNFPLLCLLVSGGNSQIVLVHSPFEMEIIGQTIDDAAGEAFDKCAKVLGLDYPGGPVIDKLAATGNSHAFNFAKPHINGLDYSFSGLKTSFLYTVRDGLKEDSNFIENNKADLAASLQQTIVEILMDKFGKAIRQHPEVKDIAVAGGVSANSAVRTAVDQLAKKLGRKAWIPEKRFTTDNAAMVAIAGYYKYLKGEYCELDEPPFARVTV